jgi:hypothetical protein
MSGRRRRIALLVAAGGFVAIQIYPRPALENPPVTAEIRAPEPVMRILRRSCYDCHSHETRWPWYARVAPSSWLVAADVEEARSLINFSTWEETDPFARAYNVEEILERVTKGEMPPARYLWLHPRARVAPEEVSTLRKWKEGR